MVKPNFINLPKRFDYWQPIDWGKEFAGTCQINNLKLCYIILAQNEEFISLLWITKIIFYF